MNETAQERAACLLKRVSKRREKLMNETAEGKVYGWRNGAKFTKFIFIHIQCCYCYSRIYLFTFNN